MGQNFQDRAIQPEKLSKEEYQERVKKLRYRMVSIQNLIRKSKVPVLILFAGVDGAGKHETVDLLSEWMDPRWLRTRAYGEPTEEEKLRPKMWKYWRDLPGEGEIGLFLSAWTSKPLLDRVRGVIDAKEFDNELDKIDAFEKTLVENGCLILKFWMHLDQDKQKERLVKLSSNELLSWQIKASDWENVHLYQKFMSAADKIVSRKGASPWTVIDGSKEKFRSIAVAEEILKGIQDRLDSDAKKAKSSAGKSEVMPQSKPSKSNGRLSKIDLSLKAPKDVYKHELKRLQSKLYHLQMEAHKKNISTVLMFEGWDAAGKGGAIRRVTKAIDARQYEVTPIAAPTQEELEHHYLWRFWRQLPRGGRMSIFDRSWYGRVLVERVEGFAKDPEWKRAYQEINDFEKELIDDGVVLCKFWLHISKDEQLRRFEERKNIPYKAWKLNDEDWRNREKWDQYVKAVEEMFQKTDSPEAPWTIIPGNDKYYARLKVLSTVCQHMEQRLESQWNG